MPNVTRYRRPSTGAEGLIGRCALQAAVLLFPFFFYFLTTLAFPVAVVLLVLHARRYFLEKDHQVGSGAYGTARWAMRSDLERARMLDNQGGLLVGRVDALPPPLWRSLRDLFLAPWSESQTVASRCAAALLSRRYGRPPGVYVNKFFNLVVIAPPGAGKGASLVVPAMLNCPKSMVVLDPKGENYNLTARHRANAFGHRVRRFDPFNVCGRGGDTFNPLATLDPMSLTVVDDALALADALVVKNPQSHDPHWDESAITALTAFILYITIYSPPEHRTLSTVAELITDPKEFQHAVALMQDRQGTLAAKFGRTHAYDSLRRFGNQLSALVDKELASVQSTIGRHLAWTNSPLVQATLAHSSIDLLELARGKTTLHLIMPPDKLESHSRLLRLWVTCCSRALVRNGLQEKNEIVFLLDEVGNCGQLKVLREGITMLRGYGARYVFVLQSIAQFKELFGDAENTVKAGFDFMVFFGIRDAATAKEMSERIGNTTMIGRSGGETHGSSGPGFLSGGQGGSSVNSSTSTNWTEVGRALVTPDELLRESERTVYVLPAGGYPIRATQARYYEDPEMAAAVADTTEHGREHAHSFPTASVPPTGDSEPQEAGGTDWAAITGNRPSTVVAPEDAGPVDWGAITSGRPTNPAPRPVPTRPGDQRIKFACPCGKRFNLAATMAGKRAKCTNPTCCRVFRIPTRNLSPMFRSA